MNAIITVVMQLVVIVMEVLKLNKKVSCNNTNNNCNIVVSNYRNTCNVVVVSDELIGSWSAVYDLKRDIIMLSESLVGLLSNKELEAVIYHELGHRFHRNSHLSKISKEEYALLVEYEADLYSCVHGYGSYMLSALEKIVKKHLNVVDLNCILDVDMLGIYNMLAKPRLDRIRRYLDIME